MKPILSILFPSILSNIKSKIWNKILWESQSLTVSLSFETDKDDDFLILLYKEILNLEIKDSIKNDSFISTPEKELTSLSWKYVQIWETCFYRNKKNPVIILCKLNLFIPSDKEGNEYITIAKNELLKYKKDEMASNKIYLEKFAYLDDGVEIKLSYYPIQDEMDTLQNLVGITLTRKRIIKISLTKDWHLKYIENA